MFPEDLQRFLTSVLWTFARTMPKWPHEYVVRRRVDPQLFEQVVEHIRANGYEGRFYGRRLTYFDDGGKVYWTMGAPVQETTIINRCRKEDSFAYRAEQGMLPR